jgi:hypothetical protein
MVPLRLGEDNRPAVPRQPAAQITHDWRGSSKMTITVKVQRPIYPPDGLWLVYDEHQKLAMAIPGQEVPAGLREAMGTRMKAYFEATVIGDDVDIGERVPDEPW